MCFRILNSIVALVGDAICGVRSFYVRMALYLIVPKMK